MYRAVLAMPGIHASACEAGSRFSLMSILFFYTARDDNESDNENKPTSTDNGSNFLLLKRKHDMQVCHVMIISAMTHWQSLPHPSFFAICFLLLSLIYPLLFRITMLMHMLQGSIFLLQGIGLCRLKGRFGFVQLVSRDLRIDWRAMKAQPQQ